jgi:hypothetical protein
MTLRDRIRVLLLFTPSVSVPLAVLGVYMALATPVMVLVPYGWIAAPVGIALAVLLHLQLRSRLRVSILDSSPMGVVTWLRRLR